MSLSYSYNTSELSLLTDVAFCKFPFSNVVKNLIICVQKTCELGHCQVTILINPISTRLFLAGVVLRGGCVPRPSITLLSLKLDYSNFAQNYFGIRSIFCDKENPDQIDNNVTMTSYFLC